MHFLLPHDITTLNATQNTDHSWDKTTHWHHPFLCYWLDSYYASFVNKENACLYCINHIRQRPVLSNATDRLSYLRCWLIIFLMTMSDYPAFRDMLCYKLLLAYVLSIIGEKENKISFWSNTLVHFSRDDWEMFTILSFSFSPATVAQSIFDCYVNF